MATAAGFRFAQLRIPTPGSGFDDQDRYALLGISLPANSITPPVIGADFNSKSRAARMRIVFPDSTLDDQQDRYTWLGIVQPTLENVNVSAQQRAFYCRIPMWPGGTGFSENDRYHAIHVYPPNEASFFSEVFDISWELRPTLTGSFLPLTNFLAIELGLSTFNLGFGFDYVQENVNPGATTSVPSNYQICDRTGFRISLYRGLELDGYGGMVRRDSADPMQPQDRIKSVSERQRGSVSPEPDDTFISTAVTPDDL